MVWHTECLNEPGTTCPCLNGSQRFTAVPGSCSWIKHWWWPLFLSPSCCYRTACKTVVFYYFPPPSWYGKEKEKSYNESTEKEVGLSLQENRSTPWFCLCTLGHSNRPKTAILCTLTGSKLHWILWDLPPMWEEAHKLQGGLWCEGTSICLFSTP